MDFGLLVLFLLGVGLGSMFLVGVWGGLRSGIGDIRGSGPLDAREALRMYAVGLLVSRSAYVATLIGVGSSYWFFREWLAVCCACGAVALIAAHLLKMAIAKRLDESERNGGCGNPLH